MEDLDLEAMLGVSLSKEETLAEKEWRGMPEYSSQNMESNNKLIIHFRSQEDRQKFAELINQPLTPKTQSTWFPIKEKDSYANRRYVSDES